MKLEIPQLHGNGSHAGAPVPERPVLALKANSAASAGPVQLSGGSGGNSFITACFRYLHVVLTRRLLLVLIPNHSAASLLGSAPPTRFFDNDQK